MIFNWALLAFFYAAGSNADVEVGLIRVFDYIVVGGGTAGLALATRLSQGLPKASILVIEAGPAALEELNINIPGKKGSTLGTKYDWNFTTIPQPGVKNRILPQNRGKVLGGSSAINLLTYDRASEHEYNGWEEMGNKGWNWDNFLDSMNKAQNFTSKGTNWYGNDEGVSTNGPIRGTINRVIPTHQNAWVPTLNKLGIATNKEYMGGNPLGVSYSSSNIDPTHYNRSYSANSYLPLAGPLLTVLVENRVAKVNMKKNGDSYDAIGVTLTNNITLTARREVILSAGSIQSPGLLELSGIGKKSILDKVGIKTLVDLPGVGENLQDHIRIQSSYQLKENFTSIDIFRYNATYSAEQLKLWLDGKLSLYDYTGSGYSFQTWDQAWVGATRLFKSLAQLVVKATSSPAQKKKLQWLSDPTIPQLEIIMSDGYTGVKGYPAANTSLYGKEFFTLIAAVMHPLSQGSIHINSSNPLVNPIIDPNYLSNEHDIAAAIAGVKKCRQIALTAPLRDVWVSEYEPGLDKVWTDSQWREYVLNTTLSIYHPTGTCSMLPKDQGGVVDSRLRVYGTRGLRVVDASIMPVIISAHLQTAVYGIAEMAASMIIEDAKGGIGRGGDGDGDGDDDDDDRDRGRGGRHHHRGYRKHWDHWNQEEEGED